MTRPGFGATRTLAGAVIALCAFACAHAPVSPRPTDEADIAAVLDDFNDAAARADEARYFAHFAPDAIFIGTDATERWDLAAFRAFSHPYFAKGKAWSFHTTSRHVVLDADRAWFDELLDTVGMGPARGSGVLRRTPEGWRISQYVLSLTVSNEKMKDVKALLDKR